MAYMRCKRYEHTQRYSLHSSGFRYEFEDNYGERIATALDKWPDSNRWLVALPGTGRVIVYSWEDMLWRAREALIHKERKHYADNFR